METEKIIIKFSLKNPEEGSTPNKSNTVTTLLDAQMSSFILKMSAFFHANNLGLDVCPRVNNSPSATLYKLTQPILEP